jgi:hypothetical protein
MFQEAVCFSIIGYTPRVPTKHGFNMDCGVDAIFPHNAGLQRNCDRESPPDEYFDSFFSRHEEDLNDSDLSMPCLSVQRTDRTS